MNLKKMMAVGTVACMVALTGCAGNIPENNQGNRNGMRLTDSANRDTTGVNRSINRSANRYNGNGTTRSTTRSANRSTTRNLKRVTRNRTSDRNSEINTRARNSVDGNYNYNGSTSSNAYRNNISRNSNRLSKKTTTRTIENRKFDNNGNVALNDNYGNRTFTASNVTNAKYSKVGIRNKILKKAAASKSRALSKPTAKTTRSTKTASFTPKNNHIVPNNPGGTVVNRSVAKNRSAVTRSRAFQPRNMHIVPNNPGGTVVNKNIASPTRSMKKIAAKANKYTGATHVVTPGTTTYKQTTAVPRTFSATPNINRARSSMKTSTPGTVTKTPVRKIMTSALAGK